MEPCVMVSTGNELCVTAGGDDDQTLRTTDSRDLALQKSKIGNLVLRFRGEACFVLQLEWKRTETVHQSQKGNYGSAGSPLVAKMAANPIIGGVEATEQREGLLVPNSIYKTIRRGDLGIE